MRFGFSVFVAAMMGLFVGPGWTQTNEHTRRVTRPSSYSGVLNFYLEGHRLRLKFSDQTEMEAKVIFPLNRVWAPFGGKLPRFANTEKALNHLTEQIFRFNDSHPLRILALRYSLGLDTGGAPRELPVQGTLGLDALSSRSGELYHAGGGGKFPSGARTAGMLRTVTIEEDIRGNFRKRRIKYGSQLEESLYFDDERFSLMESGIFLRQKIWKTPSDGKEVRRALFIKTSLPNPEGGILRREIQIQLPRRKLSMNETVSILKQGLERFDLPIPEGLQPLVIIHNRRNGLPLKLYRGLSYHHNEIHSQWNQTIGFVCLDAFRYETFSPDPSANQRSRSIYQAEVEIFPRWQKYVRKHPEVLADFVGRLESWSGGIRSVEPKCLTAVRRLEGR